MNPKTKRVLLIGGSLLVLAGVIYYFSRRNKGGIDEPIVTPQESTVKPVINESPLDTIEKIKAFQDWMDTIGPWVKGKDGKYRLLKKGAGYGTYGPSTKAAWNYYRNQYVASLTKV